ncbi:MAG: hypothetical protein WCO98_02605 [bacterium]
MNIAHVTVNAGICGFVSEITAVSDDEQMVQFTVASPCENIQGLAAKLQNEIDAYQELGAGYDGEIWTAARGTLRGCCSGCVVPTAFFKVMQIAAEVSLPCPVSMQLERIDGEA